MASLTESVVLNNISFHKLRNSNENKFVIFEKRIGYSNSLDENIKNVVTLYGLPNQETQLIDCIDLIHFISVKGSLTLNACLPFFFDIITGSNHIVYIYSIKPFIII
jgi:hypothetical protein